MLESKEEGTRVRQIPEELLERLPEGHEKPQDLRGSEGLLANL